MIFQKLKKNRGGKLYEYATNYGTSPKNAKRYYTEISRKREQHKDVVVKEEIIVISKISQIKTYKNEKLINLEDLVWFKV